MADTFNPKFGNMVAIPFTVSNPDTGASNTDIKVSSGINSLVPMPLAGSVVGISVKGNDNLTAGTITVKAHIASTEWTDAGALSVQLTSASGSSNAKYSSVRPGVMQFSAGNEIGVSYSTAAAYAPTTIDFDVVLFVMFNAD
jgi:hypothetical protein